MSTLAIQQDLARSQSNTLTIELNSVYSGVMRATTKGGELFTSGFNLTPARLAVIAILHRNVDRPLTVGEIAAGLHVSSTNISRRLDGLVEAGWVQRDKNPCDGRSIFITLTEQGKKDAEAIMPVIYQRLDELWSCFSDEDKQGLLGLLARFLDHLQGFPGVEPLSDK
jgi:DNA-binding MarR family transcriptional regulator